MMCCRDVTSVSGSGQHPGFSKHFWQNITISFEIPLQFSLLWSSCTDRNLCIDQVSTNRRLYVELGPMPTVNWQPSKRCTFCADELHSRLLFDLFDGNSYKSSRCLSERASVDIRNSSISSCIVVDFVQFEVCTAWHLETTWGSSELRDN